METTTQNELLSSHINELASQCVKCGLCLPYCPTYQLTQDENESPRGRIALFQALSQHSLSSSPATEQHLDHCLACRACERVCPAQVKYGELLVTGRAFLKKRSHWTIRLLLWLAEHAQITRALQILLWVIEKIGLRSFTRRLGLIDLLGMEKLDALLPPLARPRLIATDYAAIGKRRGKVALFTGCITGLSDQYTLLASIFVLRRLGYDVWIPTQQTCCGALALHVGEMARAVDCMKKNILVFNQPVDYIISLNTGCSATLQGYNEVESHSPSIPHARALGFSRGVIDMMSFLTQVSWPPAIKPAPLPVKIILHTPCTRKNVLKSGQDPITVLEHIPELTIQLMEEEGCCGAAGTFFLTYPQFAASLANTLLAKLISSPSPDYLVTTNIGCALHLKQQLSFLFPKLKVCHPVLLIARSLGF